MNLVGLDTATAATVAAARAGGRPAVETRDDPPPGSRPNHATRVLALMEEALAGAGLQWGEVDLIGVGVGPGGFTGLRIGVATARALSQAHGIPVAPVSTLEALAVAAAQDGGAVLGVVDARRGEAFAGAWSARGEELLGIAAYGPDELATAASALGPDAVAVGDGAVRFRHELESVGVSVPPDESRLHRLRGESLLRLAAAAEPVERDLVLPDYRRQPDATPPRLP